MKFCLMLVLVFWGSVANSTSSVASVEAQEIFQALHELYQPVTALEGAQFRIETKMESPSVVASAGRPNLQTYQVIVHGGMLNSPRLTSDALRMALCHEIGHLFGGPPHREAPMDWNGPRGEDGRTLLSGEGQSDYYAALVCFRKLVQGQDHAAFLKDRPFSLRVHQLCGEEGLDASAVCARSAWAGFDLLTLVTDFPISFETPDHTVVPRTLAGLYPSRQCRLDTYLEASACRAEFPLDIREADLSACPRKACWFKAGD